MDLVILSRIQFALNVAFHFIYPPLSIGIGLFLVILEGLHLITKDKRYHTLARFWVKIFALTFALGVSTGLVQAFAFGTNWSRYSRYVGDVFGSALAAEGVFAFFLESGFLGVLLFGWDKVKPWVHFFATVMVSLGAHFSAVWILIANSWMQTPAGYKIVGTGENARAQVTDFWAMVFNPSSMDRITHVLLGCWLAGAFFVLSVACYYLIKKRHQDLAMIMVKIALPFAMVILVAQLVSGDSSAKLVAKHQPAKLAAMEGIYETKPYTPISIAGWVDTANQKVYSIKIPAGLSLLTYHNAETPVTGLDKFPKKDWPNVAAVFQFYHMMVGMWALMFFISCLGIYYLWKKKLQDKTWLLWIFVISVVMPQIALQTGWFTAEMGRQPWIVYNLLRTSKGVSKSIAPTQVLGSITMFLFIYILFFTLFIFLLDRKIKHGPTDAPDENADLYKNIYPPKDEEDKK